MLKNIKLFSTDNDRTTYESSANYETPYVSKVTADNSVHYNTKKKKYVPTPGLSNEEDVVELANLYIEEYNIENGTNLQLRYSMVMTGDVQ